MDGKPYVVQILAKTYVETTVAVIAESEEDATRMALHGVCGHKDGWVHDSPVHDGLEVLNVSEETWDELQYAYQTHLLGPRLQ